MKTLAIAIAAALGALAPAANAQYDADRNYDRNAYPYTAPPDQQRQWRGREDQGDRDWNDTHARVLDARPVYVEGTTHQECWNEEHHRYESHGIGAGTVLGAIAGGVIGHQIGSGRGNDAATVAGAIGGGVIGNRIERERGDEEHPNGEQRCRTVADSGSAVVGYDVRYEYRGSDFTTRLDHEPGRWLLVGRDIRDDGYPFEGNVAANPSRPDYDRDRR